MNEMKLLFLLLIINTMNSQNLKIIENYENRELAVKEKQDQEPCSQTNPSNSFEDYLLTGNLNGQIVANDLFVEPETTFSLEQIKANLWSLQGVDKVDVYLLFSNQGSPNGVALFEFDIVPDNQINLGNSQGFNVYETTLNLPSSFVLDGGNEGTTYWIMLVGYATSGNDGPVGWEVTSVSQMGNPTVFNNSNEWEISDTYDGVYEFIGDCNPTLNVAQNEFNNFKIWPNPTTEKLYLDFNQSQNITSIKVLDLNGKEISIVQSNNEINVSNLLAGTYFLIIETANLKTVKKFIKR